MNVSDFLRIPINPFVLGCFFSRYIFSDDNKYIYTEYSYKKSKYGVVDFESTKKLIFDKINDFSKPNNLWTFNDKSSKFIAKYQLINDLNLDKNSFYNRLYRKIMSECEWVFDEDLSNEKKNFIRGFFESRGSIDTTADYITQDYFYNSEFEIKRLRILIDYLQIPYYVTNLNFRDLQKDFYENVNKRNTQLRIEIMWFLKNIGLLNDYKISVFLDSRKHKNIEILKEENGVIYLNTPPKSYQDANTIGKRLNYYSENIYGQTLSSDQINEIRQNLGFEQKSGFSRNIILSETIRMFSPDECVCCKDDYSINDRTFTHKRTNRPYFEIHHVISIGKNKDLDDENNLVKLCPVCHGCLKKNIGTFEEQTNLIKKLLKNVPKSLDFSKHFFDTNDTNLIISYIQENLK